MTNTWSGLKDKIISDFALGRTSIHGPDHWARVEEVGLELANENQADKEVVILFALLHDACRTSEYEEPNHGINAANLVKKLNNKYFNLSETQLDKLVYACYYHADGWVTDDVTIGTCWDADRLDLGRAGVVPDPDLLSTKAGKLYLSEGKAKTIHFYIHSIK